jgi:hypothetical protein
MEVENMPFILKSRSTGETVKDRNGKVKIFQTRQGAKPMRDRLNGLFYKKKGVEPPQNNCEFYVTRTHQPRFKPWKMKQKSNNARLSKQRNVASNR